MLTAFRQAVAKSSFVQRAPLLRRSAFGRTIIVRTVSVRARLVPRGAQEELCGPVRLLGPNIDEYIASFSPDVQAILEMIRLTIKQAAPNAQETISYKIPAFTVNGTLVYFAAFKKHIGFYPPVRGDAKLEKSISTYAGEKGNLQFPLDQPIPYGLIETIVKLRVKQNLAKAASKSKRG